MTHDARGVAEATPPALPRGRRRPRGGAARLVDEFVLLLPATVLLVGFLVVPFLMAVGLSFTDERLVPRPFPTAFVGFENYARVLTDPEFWQAFRNTATFALMVVPFQCAISLAVAILLNGALPLRSFFRTVSLLPLMTPITVVVVIWAVLYRIPDGFMNNVVQMLGYDGRYIDWLGSSQWAMPSLVLLSAWATFPFQMLIYLAGLQDIPHERYEAAQIDGASTWQQFAHVTFPGLRNTHILVLIITSIQAFKLFTQVDILTRGGPFGSTNTLVRYMVEQGYTSQMMGYASAVAVIFVVLVGGIAILQRVLIRNE